MWILSFHINQSQGWELLSEEAIALPGASQVTTTEDMETGK